MSKLVMTLSYALIFICLNGLKQLIEDKDQFSQNQKVFWTFNVLEKEVLKNIELRLFNSSQVCHNKYTLLVINW